MDDGTAWNLFILGCQIFVLLVGLLLTERSRKRSRQTGSTYECDRLYLEIAKTLLNDEKLYDFYSIGPEEERKSWNDLSQGQKRMWIFNEMYYFHFAFVYREYRRGSVSKEYWNVYDVWLKKLLRYSPIFREVHKFSKEYFEPEFKEYLDKYLATL